MRNVGWENFQVDWSGRSCEDESLNGVDELRDKFVENERKATASQIGFVVQ